jgi:hypothetical protein
MRRHPPHHLSPARQNNPAGQKPKARRTRTKPPHQRSDQTRKPVKSEQDSCSLDGNHGLLGRFELQSRWGGRLPLGRPSGSALSFVGSG